MYDALCYSCESENKLVEICMFHLKLHISLLIGGGGVNREGGLNKYLNLKMGGLIERGGLI